MRFYRHFFAFCVSLPFLCPVSAEASLLLCNNTKIPVEAAIGYREGGIWVSEGWWQIQPGQCSRAYGKPLTERFYFYYARSLEKSTDNGKDPQVWSGKYAFCSDDKAFRVVGDGECEKRDYQTNGFREVDVGSKKKDYTIKLK